jgi:hypothetical protein
MQARLVEVRALMLPQVLLVLWMAHSTRIRVLKTEIARFSFSPYKGLPLAISPCVYGPRLSGLATILEMVS